ncbi:YetF domain-containing protein [Fictibacillus sp. NRS-1165]|uniref:YetF domain-containing protein n=1 Tax=Fictibacillus sp. NRS-1165 TaxID=3144463 RepID=UPI003D2079CC
MNLGTITIEMVIGFFALFFLTKILGKTQLSQLTPFDFISALILGELVGNAMYDPDVHIWMILFAISVWGVLMYSLEMLTQKSMKFRTILEGSPSIVVRKGIIDRKQLKKNKLDINQLQSLIRQKGYFSLRDIEYAVLETNGSISVLPKSDIVPATRNDLHLPDKEVTLPVTLILDGRILNENLKTAGLNDDWLRSQLLKRKINSAEEVLYAEWKKGEELLVMKEN